MEVHLIYKETSRITFVTFLAIHVKLKTCQNKHVNYKSHLISAFHCLYLFQLLFPFLFPLPVSMCSFLTSWLPCLFACRGFPLVMYVQVLSMGRWRSSRWLPAQGYWQLRAFGPFFPEPLLFQRKHQSSLLHVSFFVKLHSGALNVVQYWFLIFFFNLKSLRLYSTSYNSKLICFICSGL